jgi:hypothetical protein
MSVPTEFPSDCGGVVVNLLIWLPAMLALGLVMIGLMVAFVVACAKV